MSRDDFQRTVDFILDQQAQFATNIQMLRETQTQLVISQGKSEARLDRIEEIVLKTVGVVERLADAQDRTEVALAALAEAQERTQDSLRELTESQARTDARLSRLAGGQERAD